MKRQDLKDFNIPSSPGVYFFKDDEKIVYIGKATSLKERVKSYFSNDLVKTRGLLVDKIIRQASSIEWEVTDSVLEALILESRLIKKHKPVGNTREKDDKSYWYVIFSNEKYPKVSMVRGKELIESIEPEAVKYTFGPFPQASELKEALKIVRKVFPFRDKCTPESGKPCFYAQLGLCPGVCSGKVTASEYARTINHLRLFFEGKKSTLLKTLEKEMKEYSKKLMFEEARVIRDQIYALSHINDMAMIKKRQSLASLKVEAYDIAHTSGKNTVGVMTVISGGVPDKSAYRKFNLKGESAGKSDDVNNLKEVLNRRLAHLEWPFPNFVVVDGGKAQLNMALKVFNEVGLDIPIVAVTKNDRHKPEKIIGDNKVARDYEDDILLANAEAHRFAISFHRQRRGRLLQ